MLGRVLDSHSLVNTFDELHVFDRLFDIDEIDQQYTANSRKIARFSSRLEGTINWGLFGKRRNVGTPALCQDNTDVEDSISLGDIYLRTLRQHTNNKGKLIPCEQTPRYIFCAEVLLNYYKDCRVVHIYRDPRAVLNSQKMRWRRSAFSRNPFPRIWTWRSRINYDPFLTSRTWTATMRIARRLSDHNRFHEICFESLVQSPMEQLQGLCDFLGIEFEEKMLEVPVIGSSHSADVENKFGLDSSKVDSWKKDRRLTETEVAICESVTKEELLDREPS